METPLIRVTKQDHLTVNLVARVESGLVHFTLYWAFAHDQIQDVFLET